MEDTQPNLCRLLLAHIRHGDFSHAGGMEAIDITVDFLKKLESDPIKLALDAGCGLGGTAASMSSKLSCEVYGVDLDKTAIDYANHHYPSLYFFHDDLLNLPSIFPENTFDLIYLFNVLYAVRDKKAALEAFSKVYQSDKV